MPQQQPTMMEDDEHLTSDQQPTTLNQQQYSFVNNCTIQPTSPMYMFEILLRSIRESKTLSDDLLKELANLFPSTTLVHALELIDKEKVVKYVAKPSGRVLFAVEPSHHGRGSIKLKKTYKCISNNYCTCHSFAFAVLQRKESRYCKHLLAVILAEALDTFKTKTVKDSEMGLLLLDED